MRVANRVAEPELVEDKEAMMGVGFSGSGLFEEFCKNEIPGTST